MNKLLRTLAGILLCGGIGLAGWMAIRPPHVGQKDDKGIMVATGQFLKPTGRMAVFNSRPVDLAISPDGKFAYMKESSGLTVVDCEAMKTVDTQKVPGGDSFCGLSLSEDGHTLCYTSGTNKLVVYDVDGGSVKVRKTIDLPAARVGGNPSPCGVVFQNADTVFVCMNRDNSVARVRLDSGQIDKWDTDVAPFGLYLDARMQRLYVSCWSRKAEGKEPQALSAGTSVPVDPRGVGLGGRLTVLDLRRGQTVDSIPIGHQASEIDPFGDQIFVPCSGSDTVEWVSITGQGHRTYKLFPNQPVGAAPYSIAVSPDERTAYIACGGRNSILVYDLFKGRTLGEYPTAWYPCAVRLYNGKLFVACTKGIGERAPEKNPNSHNTWDLTGALETIDVADKPKPLAYSPPLPPRKGMAPVAVPERSGEQSLFKHVVYVIRENRTYDQLFGDIKSGDGDPTLCNFGEAITPNAHALARQYTLLDNYYTNGICSADGHSWATEGNTTANLERSVSTWQRSYPFGDDALNTSSTGFLWDSVLEAGKTFINFGEMDYAATANHESYFSCLKEHDSGVHTIKFKQNIGVARMRQYSVPGFPGWDLSIPDANRADVFVEKLKQMEAANSMPNLVVLYLPDDHTGGPVTARAQIADNDLATGRCVEAITKSKFWKDTCIFVEEDDSQAGWDHVDGHRSPCLVISPYSRNVGRVSDFYNQTSVIRTIEHIFGLKTKSMFVSISPLMFGCFGTKLDLTPFTAVPSQIKLDETKAVSFGRAFDLSKPDQVDEKAFNRAIWADSMPGKPYPAEFEGFHGKGLAARGLTRVAVDGDD